MDEETITIKIEQEDDFEYDFQSEMKLEMEYDLHSEVKLEMEYDRHSEVKLEMETELDLPIKSEVILKEEQEYHQPDCGPTPILFPGIKEELYFQEDLPDDQGMCPFPKQGQMESGAGPHFLFTVEENTRFSSNPGHLELSPHLYQQPHQQPLQQMVQQHMRDPIQAETPEPQPNTLKQALKHLLQSLRYPITHEQQKLIVQLVKSDPRLVAAIIKQKLLYQNQPRLLVSTYEYVNRNPSNPCIQQNPQTIHRLLQQDPSQPEVQFNQQSSILSQPTEVLGPHDNIEKHALQHLLWALKSTKNPEQIKLILQIVKRDPKLMAAFIKHWLENKQKHSVVQMTHQPHRQPLQQENLLHNLRSPTIPEQQQQLLQKLKSDSECMASFIKQKQMNLNKQELRFSKSGRIYRYFPNSSILQNYPDHLHPSLQILQQQHPQQPVMGPVKPQPVQSQDVQRQALKQMSQEPGMGTTKPQNLQKQALQQLLKALNGPNTLEQQAVVLKIVKRHPRLMAAIIKRKQFNQKQQKQRISKCENTNK
uniref:Nuclear receptor coactivator CREB-bp-like interlocking domain-containing protein n=1 Tax=Timema monikensis TaxID=170555 RepID=A0A7R9EI14_9NEOP|nr:unnamed protein product [Timema monikensis]